MRPTTGWLLFACLLATYAAFVARPGANERSRIALAIAIARDGSLEIGPVLADCPALATNDFSYRDGRVYSNKAPGGSFAAAPVYAALLRAERAAGVDPLGERAFVWNAWVANVLFNAALVAAAAVAAGRVASDLAGSDVRVRVALALGLGTLVFPYATAFFSHGAAGALLLLSFAVAFAEARREGGPRAARLAAAGCLAGLAGLFEYPAILAAPVLVGYVLARTRSPRAAALFALGGAPAALALLAYQRACFGGWLTTAYAFENPFVATGGAVRGNLVFPPSLEALVGITVSPFRGLLVYSPVLALAAAGLALVWRAGARAEASAAALVGLALFALNCSYRGWEGGATHGPRYIVPAIPLLAIGLGPAFARWPRATAALAVAGGAVSLAVALTGVGVDGDLLFPLRDATLPALLGRAGPRPFYWIGPLTAVRLAGAAAVWAVFWRRTRAAARAA